MAEGEAEFLEVSIRELRQDAGHDVIVAERLRVALEAQLPQPIPMSKIVSVSISTPRVWQIGAAETSTDSDAASVREIGERGIDAAAPAAWMRSTTAGRPGCRAGG